MDEATSLKNEIARLQIELAAAQARALPEGMVLVPREPTGKMCTEGWKAWNAPHDPKNNVDCPTACYKAMLAAAQGEKT